MNHTAELIAVGTELLLGNIANLDAQIISQGLSALGITVHYHTVVGDNPQRLADALDVARRRADIIITTGGLGPTYDDLTKQTICAAFGLTGLAGGAAVAGCCANMVGFAVLSFRENRWGGLVSQGLGTSMLQMPNIVRNPRIWLPAILTSAITGPLATCLFHLEMNGSPVSSGMGTCGLVGQIGVYTGWVADVAAGTKAAITPFDWAGLVLICFVLPAILCAFGGNLLRKMGWIRENDLKLED